MAKPKFTVLSGLGQAQTVATVFGRVIEKRGGGDEDFTALTTPDGERFLEECAGRWMDQRKPAEPPKPVFVAQPPKLVKTLSLRQQFKTPEKAIKAGAYPAGHDTYITSTTYPMRDGTQEDVDVFGLDMADCFDHDPTTAEVLALAEQYGYERLVYEDALRAGAEHNGEDYQRPFVFLHVPVAGDVVLCLFRWDDDRWLHRFFVRPSYQWYREHYVFFFRRKS